MKAFIKLIYRNDIIAQAVFTCESMKQVVIEKWKKLYGKRLDDCRFEIENLEPEKEQSQFKKGSMVEFYKLHRAANYKVRSIKNIRWNRV